MIFSWRLRELVMDQSFRKLVAVEIPIMSVIGSQKKPVRFYLEIEVEFCNMWIQEWIFLNATICQYKYCNFNPDQGC